MPTYDDHLTNARAELSALLAYAEDRAAETLDSATDHRIGVVWTQRADKIRGALSNLAAIPGIGAVLAERCTCGAVEHRLAYHTHACPAYQAGHRTAVEGGPLPEPVRTNDDVYTWRELQSLAAELVSLATFADRAPTERGRTQFFNQAEAFEQRANALGYPSLADGINQARKRNTWSHRASGLRDVADHARKLAAERR